ncbi:hypothetical protein [Ancylobacter sp. G4_0304]|uniref:hypothetical protein n=1 Tax=Ancylobacter sp. G4_0304 TaxID=3114289 RepID=UPI0039C6C514
MDRRNFLLGLAGLIGAGATASMALSPAQATMLDQFKNVVPPEGLPDEGDLAAMTPDGTAVEATQWGPPPPRRGPPPRYWGPPPRRRRRRVQVCRNVRDRWGRRIRRCWYEWR